MTQISEIDYNYNVNPIKNVDVSDPSDIYILVKLEIVKMDLQILGK